MTSDVLSRVKSVTKEVYDKLDGTSKFYELTPNDYLIEVCNHMYYRYAIKSTSTSRLYWRSSNLWEGRYLSKVSESNGIIIRYTLNA